MNEIALENGIGKQMMQKYFSEPTFWYLFDNIWNYFLKWVLVDLWSQSL